jgi:glycine cleavage system H lipoate-binding protein
MDATTRLNYKVVPSEEVRCVWMTAGILSYQLCDHKFDCDNCPLDAAMRRHFPSSNAPSPTPRHIQVDSETLPQDRHYTMNHCWVIPGSEGRPARVGIEPGLSSALLVPKSVVLPSVGQEVEVDQPCVWIVVDGGTFAVPAMCSGRIASRNDRLTNEPQELFLHPLEQGWLYEIEPTNDTYLGNSMVADRALIRYSDDTEQFKQSLNDSTRTINTPVGQTLHDGGQPLQDFSELLGPKQYFSCVVQAFGKKRS